MVSDHGESQLVYHKRSIRLPQLDGSCTITVRLESGRTPRVDVSGGPSLRLSPGPTPEVVAFLTDLDASTARGMSAVARPYTWFETSPTRIKTFLTATTIACILVVLTLAIRLRRPRTSTATPKRRRVLFDARTALDVSVTTVLAAWLFIGPATHDDGFATMTVRNYAATGDIGNYYRWFNASEAPFTLVQHVMRIPIEFGLSPPLLRLPSMIAGLATWLLLHRTVLPLVCPVTPRIRWRVSLLALVFFLACWLPFNLGVRPEPYIALGTLATFACLLRATAPGTDRPFAWLATASLAAGLTVSVTPGGIAALLILGVFAPRWVPVITAGKPLRTAARWVLMLCPGCAGAVAIFADNTLHSVVVATRLHETMGPSLAWYQEPIRYEYLFDTTFAGTAAKRAAVLLVLTALFVAAVCLLRAVHRLCHAPALVPLTLSTASLFAAMCVAPSKWSHHFGSLAGIGPALLTAVVLLLGKPARARSEEPRTEDRWLGLGGASAVAVTAGLAFMGPNQWLTFNREGLHWTDTPVRPGGVPLDSPILWLAAMGCVGVLAAAMRRRRRAWPVPTLLPAIGLSGMALVSTGLMIGSFALAPFESSSAYSLTRFSYDSVTRSGCGLLDAVEALPLARDGVLRRSDGRSLESGARAQSVNPAKQIQEPYLWTSSTATSGGAKQTGSYTSPWFTLPRLGRHQVLTVWVAGRPQQGNTLSLQFADDGKHLGTRVMRLPPPATRPYADPRHGRPRNWQRFDAWRPLTLASHAVPAGARQVRVRAVDRATDPQGWLSTSAPSVRDVVPLREFLRTIHPLYLDWRLAFLAPCRNDYPRVAHGTAQSVAASIEETSNFGIDQSSQLGGVFIGKYQLSTRTEIPTRAIGSPGLDWGHLYLHTYRIQQDAYDVTVRRVQQSGLNGQGYYVFDQ
ncbi:putative arabinosyltransferase A [Streptomyces jeddahensis]|uniref:Putative arabinosyltransferase A n=2 Tax=Streptomyces jeddahensis TaxID=1716141 RepID=A0A177HHP8_9ACTN|nr:putative arabinosyltransferase A [Streptomyces jeddahensis]